MATRKSSSKVVEIRKQTRATEVGHSGLKQQGGVIREEFLRELAGVRGVQKFREMRDNNSIVGTAVSSYTNIIQELDWHWTPGDGPRGEENAEFLDGALHDMSSTWNDTLSEIMSMIVYGWSYLEVIYKRRLGNLRKPVSDFDDGRWGWRKWSIRAQETMVKWELDEEGGIQGMWQRHPTRFDTVLIPIEKALLFRTTTHKNNPEGRSLLRSAYISWYNLKHLSQIEAIGIERNLNGLPVFWIPAELLAESPTGELSAVRERIEDMAANIRNDEQGHLLMPLEYDEEGNERWRFELASSSGRRTEDTSVVIQRLKQDMAQALMMDIILMGHENVGSFALSRTKMQLAAKGIDSVAGQIQQVIERVASRTLLRINGMSVRPEDLPTLSRNRVEFADLEEVGKYLESLASSGMPLFPDEELEARIRSLGGLPPPPEDAPPVPAVAPIIEEDEVFDDEDLE